MLSPDQARAKSALRAALAQFSHDELATELDLDVRTLERYELDGIPKPRLISLAIERLLEQRRSTASPESSRFTFIDLFAGIGGTRLGFERAGGECVFTSEYDKYCQLTYKKNHRPTHEIAGDIRDVTVSDETILAKIPDHDVLVAGFPCQPFSIAGVSKKNALGRAHGFECNTQGTLFFDICKILAVKKPTAFMLENVRNLKSHDKGNTFNVIMSSLKDLGYQTQEKVIDAKPWVPQHRERIIIVGFKEPTAFTFNQVALSTAFPTLGHILEEKVDDKYTLTKHLWHYLKEYRKKHEAAGNGFGFSKVGPKDTARTLSARYYKDGSEILIDRGPGRNPRRLTPRECARLMGFPDTFEIPVSDTQAYKQFGNSVVVNVIEAVAQAMMPHVIDLKRAMAAQQVLLKV